MSSSRKRFDPVLNLSTSYGLRMHHQLARSLEQLSYPTNEKCSLLIDDGPDYPGIAVMLVREKSVLADSRWSVDYDRLTRTYVYNAIFEKESAIEIVAAIRRVLEMPELA
jgi:hypothetical protein